MVFFNIWRSVYRKMGAFSSLLWHLLVFLCTLSSVRIPYCASLLTACLIAVTLSVVSYLIVDMCLFYPINSDCWSHPSSCSAEGGGAG